MRYSIQGDTMPVVICSLEPGESMITQKGGMSWMTPNFQMQTNAGGLGKMLGKMFTGESIFQNVYTCVGDPGEIAFASAFPGSILAVQITPDHPVICQKSAFLASTVGVQLGVHFQKKLGAGLFGGEGFVLQKLTGSGIAFLEIDGSAITYNLAPGQQMVVDTGNLAMMDATCSMDIQNVKGVTNALFGGEGLFNTVITGPGRVTFQTMPVNNIVSMIAARIPSKG